MRIGTVQLLRGEVSSFLHSSFAEGKCGKDRDNLTNTGVSKWGALTVNGDWIQ